ncbi:hypothetical protein F5Y11DRAFT_245699 [Daldinia sp. FL1419]|nr:hypothetical protein F5Y11DRAFT_245699 [Daldinia sp. FL1419]
MTPHSHPTIAAAAAILLIAALLTPVDAAAYENLAGVNNQALFPQSTIVYDPGFGPRHFVDGRPASPALPPLRNRAKRQDQIAQCSEGEHSCLEVGPLGATVCCNNDEYCFINSSWEAKCCSLGITCQSPCPEDYVYTNSTTTTTVTVATSPTATFAEETSLVPSCSPRLCGSTYFLCQQQFGGQCCEFGQKCISSGLCSVPPTSSPSPVPPASTGCISCATGGGCCSVGSTCTSSIVAATSTAQLCANNLTVVHTDEGLPEGARVGIGVGVAVGASLVIGGITWFWIHRRRAAKSRDGGTLAGSGRDERDLRAFIPPGPVSDVTSPSSRMGMRPPLHEDGLLHEYYGPDAVAGPYTDRGDTSIPSWTYGTEPRSSPEFSDQTARVANRYPDAPGDIVRPTELGATCKEARVELDDNGSVKSDRAFTASRAAAAREEKQEEAYELYGSPVTSPVPMNSEEAERHRSQQPSPDPDQMEKARYG